MSTIGSNPSTISQGRRNESSDATANKGIASKGIAETGAADATSEAGKKQNQDVSVFIRDSAAGGASGNNEAQKLGAAGDTARGESADIGPKLLGDLADSIKAGVAAQDAAEAVEALTGESTGASLLAGLADSIKAGMAAAKASLGVLHADNHKPMLETAKASLGVLGSENGQKNLSDTIGNLSDTITGGGGIDGGLFSHEKSMQVIRNIRR